MVADVPFGQKLLIGYTWLSMGFYLALVVALLKWRTNNSLFRTSYYTLFLLQAVANFHVLLVVELMMRPRKFNYFNLFSKNMHAFAIFSYFDVTFAKIALCCGHMIISFNRLTAFYNPLTYEKVREAYKIL